MARLDRCSICDYNESLGSLYGNERPNGKKVRSVNGDLLCESCLTAIVGVLYDFGPVENGKEPC